MACTAADTLLETIAVAIESIELDSAAEAVGSGVAVSMTSVCTRPESNCMHRRPSATRLRDEAQKTITIMPKLAGSLYGEVGHRSQQAGCSFSALQQSLSSAAIKASGMAC